MPARHLYNLASLRLGSRLLLVLAVASLILSGCADATPEPLSQAAAARSHVEQGPVQLTVEVMPRPARLSDNLVMTITLTVEQGVTVEKPEFGTAWGEFLIRDFHEPLIETRGQHEIIRQIYMLEPAQAGALIIPPLTIVYHDWHAGSAAPQQTITSEPLTLSITSVIESTPPAFEESKHLAGPVPLEEPKNFWLWGAGAMLIAGAAFAIWWGVRKRRRAANAERLLSPRERAERELERLLAAGLAHRDVKQFYIELTGILRRYIEQTTGVHAPEQTTEEFLQAIGRSPSSTESERARLKEFLESADLVKFAAQHPRVEDIQESIERARDFIRLGVASREEVTA